jgi:hypothetical protein
VLALTGSQGKTGTKDFLAQLLAADGGETVATAGNFNNELGVPLTVLRATPTRYLVVEMGARGIGHIAYLCEIARPTSPPSSTSAPRTSASSAPGGDRAGQGRDRRGAAARRRGGAQRRRPAGRRDGVAHAGAGGRAAG